MCLFFIGRGHVPSEADILVVEKFDWGVLLISLLVERNGREGSRISQREKLIYEAVLVLLSVSQHESSCLDGSSEWSPVEAPWPGLCCIGTTSL